MLAVLATVDTMSFGQDTAEVGSRLVGQVGVLYKPRCLGSLGPSELMTVRWTDDAQVVAESAADFGEDVRTAQARPHAEQGSEAESSYPAEAVRLVATRKVETRTAAAGGSQ